MEDFSNPDSRDVSMRLWRAFFCDVPESELEDKGDVIHLFFCIITERSPSPIEDALLRSRALYEELFDDVLIRIEQVLTSCSGEENELAYEMTGELEAELRGIYVEFDHLFRQVLPDFGLED